MPNDFHLPGYNVDDDAPDDPEPAERQLEEEPLSAVTVSTGAGDAVSSTALATSVTPPSEPVSVSVSTQPTPTPPSQQREGEEDSITTTLSLSERLAVDEFADPKISSLHAIFPDFDAALLYSVVDSVGGDQDRAVDALLAMSDPEHVSTVHSPAREQPSVAEQTQLDEEFARQLLLEDEQLYARQQVAWQQQQGQGQQGQQQEFPYAQRTNAPQQGGRGNGTYPRGDVVAAQQPPPQQRDTMTDVQEQFSKLAETGKRTFTSFVSKVKAKVQEFDQNRNTQTPSSPGASTATGYAVGQLPSPVLDRHAQQAYYAPRAVHNARQGSISDESQNPPQLPASSASDSLRDSADVPPPPQTHSGRPISNIDPGKIGLLPKRSVSLVSTESQPGRAHDEEEEELEYVENPFEEGKYS